MEGITMTVPYTLIRAKRKTIALYVRDGRIEVRAPLKASKSAIDKFVEKAKMD